MAHQGTKLIQCDLCGREVDTGETWESRAYASARRMGWKTTDFDKRWVHGDDICPDCNNRKKPERDDREQI